MVKLHATLAIISTNLITTSTVCQVILDSVYIIIRYCVNVHTHGIYFYLCVCIRCMISLYFSSTVISDCECIRYIICLLNSYSQVQNKNCLLCVMICEESTAIAHFNCFSGKDSLSLDDRCSQS